MDVILSIKPRFVVEIIAGRKTFEFRKTIFKKPVKTVYVYASSPVCRIVGEFLLGDVLVDKPNVIWSRTHNNAGISKDYFDNYYKNKDLAYALEIKDFKLYKESINPYDAIEQFTPPQSYRYIRHGLLTSF